MKSSQEKSSACSKVLEKIIVAHLVKKLTYFVETKVSVPCSQETATGPAESSKNLHIL
jgi:hypothetical protein